MAESFINSFCLIIQLTNCFQKKFLKQIWESMNIMYEGFIQWKKKNIQCFMEHFEVEMVKSKPTGKFCWKGFVKHQWGM